MQDLPRPWHLELLVEEPRITVPCPRRRERISVDACPTCEHYAGMTLDPGAARSYLRCRYEPTVPGALREPVHAAARFPTGAGPEAAPLASIMATEVVSVEPGTSLAELERILRDNAVSGLPVVSAEGSLVGVVSASDVVRARAEQAVGRHARDLMTAPARTISVDATVADAAREMTRLGVHRLVVTDEDARIAGLVSALDVVRFAARPLD